MCQTEPSGNACAGAKKSAGDTSTGQCTRKGRRVGLTVTPCMLITQNSASWSMLSLVLALTETGAPKCSPPCMTRGESESARSGVSGCHAAAVASLALWPALPLGTHPHDPIARCAQGCPSAPRRGAAKQRQGTVRAFTGNLISGRFRSFVGARRLDGASNVVALRDHARTDSELCGSIWITWTRAHGVEEVVKLRTATAATGIC